MARKKKADTFESRRPWIGRDAPEWPSHGFIMFCAEMMVNFWRLAVMRRMQGGTTNPIMNGHEFVHQMNDEFRGIAYYQLEKWRQHFAFLEKHGYITQSRINTGQYGFGDDEGFQLTEKARKIIFANKKPSSLKFEFGCALRHDVSGYHMESGGHRIYILGFPDGTHEVVEEEIDGGEEG